MSGRHESWQIDPERPAHSVFNRRLRPMKSDSVSNGLASPNCAPPLRFGGLLTNKFLQLDNEIKNFAARCGPEQQYFATGSSRLVGVDRGLQEQLERMEQLAIALRHEAELEQDRWLDVLHGGSDPDDVGEGE
jgi:hypothetical protein